MFSSLRGPLGKSLKTNHGLSSLREFASYIHGTLVVKGLQAFCVKAIISDCFSTGLRKKN